MPENSYLFSYLKTSSNIANMLSWTEEKKWDFSLNEDKF